MYLRSSSYVYEESCEFGDQEPEDAIRRRCCDGEGNEDVMIEDNA